MATIAAQRLGFTPSVVHRDSPSCPGDGRSNRGEAPDAHVLQSTQGDSREHRPDRNHVRLDVSVEHPAGLPMLLQPRSGKTSAASDVGPVVTHPMTHLPTAHGVASLGADRAL
jgi:hypothetical protein